MTLPPYIREAFAIQEGNCARMGAPFTAHLCARLPEVVDLQSALGARLRDWPGDPVASALALRLCGALHCLVREGASPALGALYPPNSETGSALDRTLAETLAAHERRVIDLIATPPQTNEIGRSGVLIGGLMRVAAETNAPIELWEIGAAAGLNMQVDRFAFDFGEGRRAGPAGAPLCLPCDWRGAAPALRRIEIVARRGVDIAPLDPGSAEDRARLFAFIWPEQPHRLARTRAALDLARDRGPRVEAGDAADWVEARLAETPQRGCVRVLMHSIMWQYLPAVTKARIEGAIGIAGSRAAPDTPLAWLRLERDDTPGSAALTLTLWPGGQTRLLARADFHGSWAEWLGAPFGASGPAAEGRQSEGRADA